MTLAGKYWFWIVLWSFYGSDSVQLSTFRDVIIASGEVAIPKFSLSRAITISRDRPAPSWGSPDSSLPCLEIRSIPLKA